MSRLLYLCGTMFLFAAFNAGARAQGTVGAADTTTQQTSPAGDEAHELAKKLSNPASSLISVPFQSDFDFGMGGGEVRRTAAFRFIVTPLFPRE